MTAGDASAPSIAAEPLQTSRPAGIWPPPSRGLGAWIEERLDRERDQLPLWLPVGLGLGIAAWFALPDSRAWTAFLLLAAALRAGAAGAGAGNALGQGGLASSALAAIIGCLNIWWKAERVAAPRLERARAAEFDAAVESCPARFRREEKVRLLLQAGRRAAACRRGSGSMSSREGPAGRARSRRDACGCAAYLMPPAPAAVPGAYDFARAAWFQGIGATGRRSARSRSSLRPARQGWRARLAGWRQRLADHIRRGSTGGEGGIAAALATGDQGGIPEADAEAMRRSGPRPSALGQRPPSHRSGRRGDAR